MGRTLIEKRASESITLLIPNGSYIDGRTCPDQIPAVAIVSEFSQRDVDWIGNVSGGIVFIIPATFARPTINSQIEYNDRVYDISGIKVYRNSKGVVIGYRCATSGGQ